MKTKTAWICLIGMVLIWGLVWPINKIGLTYTSAWNYIEWRMLFGMITSFVIAGSTGNLRLPRKQDLPIILTVGIFQMGAMMCLSNYGLSLVGAGQATFLSFTTSIWIIPLSICVHRSLPRLEILSFLLGLTGVLLMIDMKASSGIGFISLIASAISWAIGILCARYLHWHRPPIQLLPWQLLVATLLTLSIATLLGTSIIPRTTLPLFFASFLFTGSVSIAIGYWLMILISKHLPPSITSLGLLCVPILSLGISVGFLGERITMRLGLALLLIMLGILLHIYSERKRRSKKEIDVN